MKGNQNQLKKQYEMCVCVRYEGRIINMQEHNNKGPMDSCCDTQRSNVLVKSSS